MPVDFPTRIGDLDVAWLSDALGLDIRSLTFDDVGSGKGMMGDIFRLNLELSDGLPRTLIAKFSADREDLRAAAKRGGIFEREINFYRRIAPVLQCRIPRCFGTWYEPETEEFLILMELIEADTTVNQIEGVSFDQARLVMKEFAALHVPEFEVAEFRHLFSLVSAPERRQNQTLFVTRGWEEIKKLVPESLHAPYSADEMASKLVAAFDHLSQLPFYLLHGDARPDNLLFLKDGSGVALIDWQGVALGPREWDLGYFFAQGLRTEDRRRWMDDLIDVYITESARRGTMLDKKDFMLNIGKAAWFAFGVSCSLFTIADTSSAATVRLAASMGERSLSLLYDANELP